jgi:hypothetical protein
MPGWLSVGGPNCWGALTPGTDTTGAGIAGGIAGGMFEAVIGPGYIGGACDIGGYWGGAGGTLRLWLAVAIVGRFGGDEL